MCWIVRNWSRTRSRGRSLERTGETLPYCSPTVTASESLYVRLTICNFTLCERLMVAIFSVTTTAFIRSLISTGLELLEMEEFDFSRKNMHHGSLLYTMHIRVHAQSCFRYSTDV